MVTLAQDPRGFSYRMIKALVEQGWRIRNVPANARLPVNKLQLVLVTPDGEDRFRVLVYSIGSSGRGKHYERRIEITSTYFGGSLLRQEGFEDLVLGYEREEDTFVGFDPRRLHHGGPTQNASSFFDVEGLRLANSKALVVIPRESDIFDVEYHAFFKPSRIAEYMCNHEAIHAGTYQGLGRHSATTSGRRVSRITVADGAASGEAVRLEEPQRPVIAPRAVSARQVTAIEGGNYVPLRRAQMTPERLEQIRRRCDENGLLGEKFILDSERRRLRAAGRIDLADAVRWTSRETVVAGFDISSFEVDGTERFIEVKATEGTGHSFEVTTNEWAVAERLGTKYLIARVSDVRREPHVEWLRDPVALVPAGALELRASGWLITIR